MRGKWRDLWSVLKELWGSLRRFLEDKTKTTPESNPKTYKWVIGTALVILLFVILGGLRNFSLPKGSDQMAAVGAANSCRRFDIDDWASGQGSLLVSKSVLSVASSSSNGLLKWKKKVAPNSRLRLVFTPLSESEVNFVIHMHDLYEIAIGDGGYQGVTLKTPPEWDIIQNTSGDKRNIFKSGGLKRGVESEVVITQELSTLENGSMEVQLRMLYRPQGESRDEKLFATYDFPLPPEFAYSEKEIWLSIGMLQSSDDSNVSAKVHCFDIV